jgi:hypothetical protein
MLSFRKANVETICETSQGLNQADADTFVFTKNNSQVYIYVYIIGHLDGHVKLKRYVLMTARKFLSVACSQHVYIALCLYVRQLYTNFPLHVCQYTPIKLCGVHISPISVYVKCIFEIVTGK